MTGGDAAPGRQRHRTPWRSVLALTTCLAIVAAVSWARGEFEEHRVVTDTAAVGERFQMRAMSVEVTGVTMVGALTEYDKRHPAHGVFVVVSWTMQPLDEPTGVGNNVSLRTADGHVYRPTGSSITSRANPGFVVAQTTVFDVPRDRAAGAVMVIPPPGSIITGGYDRELAVPLGIASTSRPAANLPDPTPTPPAVAR